MSPVIAVLIKVAPTIIMALVKLAEIVFADKPKSGAEKKDFVLETFRNFASTATGVFSGGAAATWDRIDEYAGVIVDAASNIAFPHEPGNLSDMGDGH